MDNKDKKILRALVEDGRISNQALADRVGLSPSACLRRVQELERRGVIRGYRARLDATALGTGFIAYVGVSLSDHTRAAQLLFEAHMQASDEVTEIHNVTGTIEYLLRVEVADMAAYKHFHSEVLGAIPKVNGITSYIVMASPKDGRS